MLISQEFFRSDPVHHNPLQYTGRYHDGTGLYYYRARYYSPKYHRFISQDPIGFAGGINVYRYVGDNPTNYTDPSGQFIVAAAVGGVIGGVAGGFGAWATGGDWHDIAAAAGMGALTGGLIGFTDGASLLVRSATGAAVGGIGDAIGQEYHITRHPCSHFNYGALIGSTIGGAIGGPFAGVGRSGLSGITGKFVDEFSNAVLAGKFELAGSAIGTGVGNAIQR
jgi:RHS repeat-associated protein